MYEKTKYELNKMLNNIPSDRDTLIQIVRTGGDSLTFYQYERYKLRLFDDYLIYYRTEEKPQKVLYSNIVQIKWRPVFKDKSINIIIDGEYKVKGE